MASKRADSVSVIGGSFRDPSGFLFQEGGILYRQVNSVYKEHYEKLMESGLYKRLVELGMLIPHREVKLTRDGACKVLEPEPVEFISYPYEWSFSQLKDAALLTLEMQKRSLEFGMVLKDASAYNVQFRRGKPIFIDTLSFEIYEEGKPWVAYRQFCKHFLAPLALMAYKDARLGQLLRVYLDGIPLTLASKLLPKRAYFNIGLLIHIKAHTVAQNRYANKATSVGGRMGKVPLNSMLGLVDSLESCVSKLRWKPEGTEWADYYSSNSHASEDSAYIICKKRILGEYMDMAKPKVVWALGANTGMFSRVAAGKGAMVISCDIDLACVELSYLEAVKNGETDILPLVLDLTNPSPGIGWDNKERLAFGERGKADTVLALALVHHLVISNNIPLDRIARFLGKVCTSLVIEFVPKSDQKVQEMLAARKDVFSDYNEEAFEGKFGEVFVILKKERVNGSGRIMYLMIVKGDMAVEGGG